MSSMLILIFYENFTNNRIEKIIMEQLSRAIEQDYSELFQYKNMDEMLYL